MTEPLSSMEIATDRRSNLVLRVLIDEMLERVRELNRRAETWSGSDRARAEAELAFGRPVDVALTHEKYEV